METLLEFRLLKAATLLNISPFDLLEREDADYWIDCALTFKAAENIAEEIRVKADQIRNRNRNKL